MSNGEKYNITMATKIPKQKSEGEHVFENTWHSIVGIFGAENNSVGSGVIIHLHLVLTAAHVVGDRKKVGIVKYNNKSAEEGVYHEATILKQNLVNDICLLQVSNMNRNVAKIRDYNTINIGETVYHLSSPLGIDLSLTAGIVSRLKTREGVIAIQTDAAVSPGSSGGGLFDSVGNLIGIMSNKMVSKNNKGIFNGVEGIGYAVPASVLFTSW